MIKPRLLGFACLILGGALRAQTLTGSSTAAPGSTQDNSGAAVTRPVVSAASDPATCTAGKDAYINTAATPVLKICIATNTWAASGGAGTPATGMWFSTFEPNNTSPQPFQWATVVNGGGVIRPRALASQASTVVAVYVATVGAGRVIVGYYNTAMTALLCSSTPAVDTSTGWLEMTWASGTNVSGGTCTTTGDYRIVIASDDTTVKLQGLSDSSSATSICGAYINTQPGGASVNNRSVGFSNMLTISTGSGAGLALNASLASIAWTGYTGGSCNAGAIPIVYQR
jgi:hypothetical protein